MGRLRTPGPGAYEVPSHLTLAGSPKGKPTASFASNSARGGRTGRDGSGDPGAYDVGQGGVHLGKKEPISARSRRSFNRDVGLGRGSFNSTTTRATSAPPRSLRGGPGEHDFSHLYSCGNASTQVSSSFLSSVPLAGHIRKSHTPGVGEYDPTLVESKQFSRAEGSAAFAGSLKSRSSAGATTTGENVGPGSYELEQTSIREQMADSVNPRLPGFGSSSIRVGPGGRSRSPAPGAYDPEPQETVSARSQRSFNTSASGGRASFGTFTTRDDKSRREGGDPGKYTVEHPGVHTGKAESIAARSQRSFNRDVGRGRGSFNSTTTRSQTPTPHSTRGGPGEHDFSHLYSCGNASTQVSSSFLSSVPLAGHIRKSHTPGVGEYDPEPMDGSSKSISKEGSASFAGSLKSRSASNFSTTGENVGPGTYDLGQRSIYERMLASTNPRLPGFGSSSVRQGPEA